MSLYIELKNWDGLGDKTFLVHSFNAASKFVDEKGLFGVGGNWQPAPGVTEVVLDPGGFRDGGTRVKIALGYEEFKEEILRANARHTIPSFAYLSKYIFGDQDSNKALSKYDRAG